MYDLVMGRLDGKRDRPAADATIFNVLLVGDRTVNKDFDFFPAVRALDNGRLKRFHEVYLSTKIRSPVVRFEQLPVPQIRPSAFIGRVYRMSGQMPSKGNGCSLIK